MHQDINLIFSETEITDLKTLVKLIIQEIMKGVCNA